MENQNFTPPDCFRPAPIFYRLVMHIFHVFTIPVYIATLIVLFREPSKAFQTYKYYIIVHVSINIVSELLVCYFILPDTYLPHMLLRMTGWLAQWGFSGIIMFYTIAQFALWTGGSVLEMFYYRFKVCILHHQNHLFSKILRAQVVTYRIGMFLHPLIAGVTFGDSIKQEEYGRQLLWNSNRTAISAEVTCYNVFIANSDSYILWTILPIYILMMLLAASGAGGTLLYITNFINKSVAMSKVTEKLQRMLIFSLFIQAGVHAAMILAPVLVLIYAFFFELTFDIFARFFVMIFAQHGFVSTCAMVIFTKPLRDKVLPCFKNIRLGKPEPSSTVATSTSMDHPN